MIQHGTDAIFNGDRICRRYAISSLSSYAISSPSELCDFTCINPCDFNGDRIESEGADPIL